MSEKKHVSFTDFISSNFPKDLELFLAETPPISSHEEGTYLVTYHKKIFDKMMRANFGRLPDYAQPFITKISEAKIVGSPSDLKEFEKVLNEVKPQNYSDSLYVFIPIDTTYVHIIDAGTGAYDPKATKLTWPQQLAISRTLGRGHGNQMILKNKSIFRLKNMPENYSDLSPQTNYVGVITIS